MIAEKKVRNRVSKSYIGTPKIWNIFGALN